MPKTKISEYSSTANSNTDVGGINIDEGCAPSGINDAIRTMMAQLKNFQTGTGSDSFNGPVNGAVNGTVGATTPATGAFTTLTTSSTVTHNGGTANGVAYLNGSKVLTTGSALVFDGTNLGIGTTSPSVRLQVYNNINGTPFAWGNATRTGYLYQDASGVGITNASGTGFDEGVFLDTANSATLFYTQSTERARIDSSGNLLVGQTGTGLQAARSFSFQGVGDGSCYVSHSTANASGDSYIQFGYNATKIGSITQNGTTATAYNTSSDYRLKNITGPITSSGAYIDSLNPVEGTWKADGSVFVGLIAHEAQEVSRTPIATGEKDGVEMQGMSYSNSEMIANMIAELKSLRARVEQLESN